MHTKGEVIRMLEHLRGRREDKDMTQTQVARLLNIHQTTYSDYELGELNIPNETLKKLALLLDTSIDYLLGLTDDPAPYPRKK